MVTAMLFLINITNTQMPIDNHDLQKQTVLIVDDTAANIDVLSGVLKERYRVKAALDGVRALKIAFSDTPPDLILLDIMMPGMDGYSLCRTLKADTRTRHIPIIFVTARREVADEQKGLALGAVDYITKPISPPIVLARVATHLALHDQNRELERKVHERTIELRNTRLEIIQMLGRAAEYKDNQTGMHVIRMSHYAKLLGRAAGLSEDEAEMLLNAAPMHDIGKIGIPDQILLKPGSLNDEEKAVMRKHPEFGAAIIGQHNNELLKLAYTVALTHHEKWDGTGYPQKLAGENIPYVGRIVAIADVFDALTSARPYKAAWSDEDALAMMEKQSGRHFDPQLMKIFREIMPDIMKIHSEFGDDKKQAVAEDIRQIRLFNNPD